MPIDHGVGKPRSRRYSGEEKAAAVRMVRSLRAETGMSTGSVRRVAEQLGYGVESVRSWVKQADIDEGARAGVTSRRLFVCGSLSRRFGSFGARTRFCGAPRLSSGRSSTASSAGSRVH